MHFYFEQPFVELDFKVTGEYDDTTGWNVIPINNPPRVSQTIILSSTHLHFYLAK